MELNESYPELEEVILYIQRNIDDPLTLAKLAKHVSYSPYHFSRIFKAKTGLSPLYYVSSLRLQKAKDLLLQTDLTVRDIGLEIGQQSLGTFTTRFAERVGMTPAHFRHSVMQADDKLTSLQNLKKWEPSQLMSHPYADITGSVEASEPFQGVILIGLFPKPIPEGLPLYGTIISAPGEFHLPNVEPGRYFLMATSLSWGTSAIDVLLPHKTLRTRSRNPINVKPFTPIPHQHFTLYPPKIDDPPILISLPVLMNNFLKKLHDSN